MTTQHNGEAGCLRDSFSMPRRTVWVVVAVLCGIGGAFAVIRATMWVPIDVTWAFYFNTVVVYGLWVGFILFFMAHSLRGQKPSPDSPPRSRFLCFIPAYSESEVIANSVHSLMAQDYPRELFEIVVIFDGTDDTGDIAERLGARVVRTPRPGSGKHAGIAHALDQLVRPDDDRYIVVFDADNVVAPEFLRRINDAIVAGGYRCLQGYHGVLNEEENWVTKALWCATSASSRLYNLGRFNSFGNALVCGTGWVCEASLLRKYWSRVRTQTEDIELNGILLLYENIRVAWVVAARFYDEKPVSLWVAVQQRRRWMTGHMRTFGLLAWPCLREGIRRRNGALFEIALYYAVPFAMSLSVVQLFVIQSGIALDVFRTAGPLASVPAQVALSAITLFYMLIYQAIGFAMENGWRWRTALYALYTVVFSVIVWTMALVWSWCSLHRGDWMYHTPHVAGIRRGDEASPEIAGVQPVDEASLKVAGERV